MNASLLVNSWYSKIVNISFVEGNPLENIYETQRVKYVLRNGKSFTIDELLKQP